MVASPASFVALPRPALQCSLSSSSASCSSANFRFVSRRESKSAAVVQSRSSLRVRAGPDGESPPTAQKQSVVQTPRHTGTLREAPESAASPLQTILVEDQKVSVEGVAKVDRKASNDDPDWGRIAFLAGGDIIFLLAFAAIGRLSHGMSMVDWDALRTADPFVAGWLLGAYFLGGYGPEGQGVNGYSRAVLAAVKSWAMGIPLGLVIRGVTTGHVPAQPFILVSMASTFVLLIGWRAAAIAISPSQKSVGISAQNRKGSVFELLQLLTSLVRRW